MATLNWTKWSPDEGCIKAEGEHVVWLVTPCLADADWNLFKIANDSDGGELSIVGTFGNLAQAQTAAQRAEQGLASKAQTRRPGSLA